MIKRLRFRCSAPFLCRVLNVSASGYYSWLNRKSSNRAQEDGRLEVEIQAAHKRTRQTCGPDRLQKDLADYGVQIGIYRIRKIRKKLETGIEVQADKEIQGNYRFKAQFAGSGQSA